MSVVTLSNPNSRSAAKHLGALHAALPTNAQTTHFVTESMAELDHLIANHPWQSHETLVINGGDGSVQRVLTLLRARLDFALWPRIAILPAGHTNMSAYDVNLHRQFDHCLNRLSTMTNQDTKENVHHQPVVQVENGGKQNLGFFFGIGTIVSGIEYFHAQLRPMGGGHEVGAALALLRTLWGILRKQPPFAESLPVTMPSRPVSKTTDHSTDFGTSPIHPIRVRLCLVTTLQRLFLGMRPYWGTHKAPLRATLVEERATQFLLNLPRLMRGRPNCDMTIPSGYHSENLNDLALNFTGPYTLDGELFNNVGELKINATPPLRFLKL